MNKNTPATIATAVVAVFAVVIAIIAIMKYAEDKKIENELEEEQNSVFVPTDDIKEEMEEAAVELIKNNYTVVKLFYTIGMPHEDEPYDNLPEDGYYTAISDEYKNTEEIFKIVDETFTEESAANIKENPHGFGPMYADKENGKLGINAEFEPDYEYPVDWSSATYVAVPVSNTECNLKVTLYVDGTPIPSNIVMMKINGRWLLDAILY